MHSCDSLSDTGQEEFGSILVKAEGALAKLELKNVDALRELRAFFLKAKVLYQKQGGDTAEPPALPIGSLVLQVPTFSAVAEEIFPSSLKSFKTLKNQTQSSRNLASPRAVSPKVAARIKHLEGEAKGDDDDIASDDDRYSQKHGHNDLPVATTPRSTSISAGLAIRPTDYLQYQRFPCVTMEGYLEKAALTTFSAVARKGKGKHRLDKRYFVLEGKFLTYHTSHTTKHKACKDIVHSVQGAQIAVPGRATGNIAAYGFELSRNGELLFLLFASCEEKKDMWVRVLKAATVLSD